MGVVLVFLLDKHVESVTRGAFQQLCLVMQPFLDGKVLAVVLYTLVTCHL